MMSWIENHLFHLKIAVSVYPYSFKQILVGKMMDFIRLEYIKNVNDDNEWAYEKHPLGAYFQLNFKKGEGVDTHALNLPKGALIILSQRPPIKARYLTHVVELVNEGSEDKPQWTSEDTWGIFRWVKVHWFADFKDLSNMPLDKDVMKVDWGWQNTLAKSLSGDGLMTEWKNIEALRTHLRQVFNYQ